MLRLRFSFISRGSQTEWKCDIIERLDSGSNGWFVPFECYHPVAPLTSQITKTSMNDTISEYTIKSTYGYGKLRTAIDDTEAFTEKIKQFVEKWRDDYKQESYEITI